MVLADDGSASCVKYKRYYDELSYCADPLYWSHYAVSDKVLRNLTALENKSKSDYAIIRDNVWYNEEVLTDTKVNQVRLSDCLGFAQRIACHRNLPRCIGGRSKTLCKSLCKEFHSRCTIDGYNFITRVLGETYDLYSCEGLKDNDCSPAVPRAMADSWLILTTTASLLFLMLR